MRGLAFDQRVHIRKSSFRSSGIPTANGGIVVSAIGRQLNKKTGKCLINLTEKPRAAQSDQRPALIRGFANKLAIFVLIEIHLTAFSAALRQNSMPKSHTLENRANPSLR